MTILASREPTCISDLKNKEIIHRQQLSSQEKKDEAKLTINDICRESRKKYYKYMQDPEKKVQLLSEKRREELKDEICKFFYPKYILESSFSSFQRQGTWDLEDVKKEGHDCKRCPYYGCYAMHDNADIVFCSYNYLIDPSLRTMTDIKYANSVIVFDEAHNIEDICRNSFTLTFDVEAFEKDIKSCVDNLILKSRNRDPFSHYAKTSTVQKLCQVSDTFKKWCDQIREAGSKLETQDRNSEAQKTYEREELLNMLKEMGMMAKDVNSCLEKIGQPSGGLLDDPSNDKDESLDRNADLGPEEFYRNKNGEKRPFKVSTAVGEFLQRLLQPLVYLCQEEQEGIGGVKDFKGFLTRLPNPDTKPKLAEVSPGVQVQVAPPEFLYRFEIICLNPAVGFRVLRNCAYSIIVASGTLTPLASFAGELATNFVVTLQADHVIPYSNVWAGVVQNGPRNISLELTKKYQNDLDIQDEVGQIIFDICCTVPNGVLVFFPSYGLMQNMTNRWREYPSGYSTLYKISKKKLIFFEESKDKQLFKQNMERYKEEVKGGPSYDGCILFAVFRGKISEGIDFADEQARAVITIGIPYSNIMAPGVASKREYNNMIVGQQQQRRTPFDVGRQLLSGSEWYITQAFRAMNQGFGRCVRHSEDWGALIMIDRRLAQKRNQPYISGWIKKSMQVPAPENFNDVKHRLSQFVEKMKRKEKANKKRAKIRIEYERNRPQPNIFGNGLDETEMINFPNDDIGVDPAEQEIDNADMPTQVLDMSTSTIFSQEDTGNVGESSPEYSFSQEIELANRQHASTPPPQVLGEEDGGGGDQDQEDENDSQSVSIFERSPSPPPSASTPMFRNWPRVRNPSGGSENMSDFEMSMIADDMEIRASQGEAMNISQISQGSSISYHSSTPE